MNLRGIILSLSFLSSLFAAPTLWAEVRSQTLVCSQIFNPIENDGALLRQLAQNVENSQKSIGAVRELGRFFYVRKRWQEAQIVYASVIESDQATAGDIHSFLFSLKKLAKYSEAIRWFEENSSRITIMGDWELLSLMALIYNNQGQALFTEANKTSAVAFKNELYRLGHEVSDKAEQIYRRLWTEESENPQRLLDFAQMLINRKKYQQTLDLFAFNDLESSELNLKQLIQKNSLLSFAYKGVGNRFEADFHQSVAKDLKQQQVDAQ